MSKDSPSSENPLPSDADITSSKHPLVLVDTSHSKSGDTIDEDIADEEAEAEIVEPPRKPNHSVWYFNKIPLKELFPVSHIHSIKPVFNWLLLTITGWGAYAYFAHNYHGWKPQSPAMLGALAALGIATVIVAAKILYHELYRMRFNYEIEGFRLNIRRGIIIPEHASLPLLQMGEVYVRRDSLDLLLGLADVHIVVPLDATKRMALIEGLRLKTAYQFQDYLTAQLSKQVFVPQIPETNHENGEKTQFNRMILKEGRRAARV
jgi:membrane protein YdbS with pleckstrin-like domain